VAGRRDDPAVLRLALERDGVEVVGEARSRARLLRLAAEARPDVVVLAEGLGSDAIAALRTLAPPPRVVAVTDDPARGAAADGRVAPSAVLRDLVDEVRRVIAVDEDPLRARPAWVARAADPRRRRSRGAPRVRGRAAPRSARPGRRPPRRATGRR